MRKRVLRRFLLIIVVIVCCFALFSVAVGCDLSGSEDDSDNSDDSNGSSDDSGDSNSDSDDEDDSNGDTIIDIAEIPGVTPPAYGETPVTAITETAQYTGTVSWSPADDPFEALTVYTANITLTAKSGYTLTGVPTDFFTVAGANTVTNDAGSGVVTAEFPATEDTPPDVIDIAAIPGVTVPVLGETPVTVITETTQYTGTVSWSPADTTFAGSTVYTATITLTAKTGYTLTGVSADFFTVAGATSVTNDADSGVVTAVFPETAAAAEESSGFDSATAPGDTGVLTLNGSSETITMIYANDSDMIAYPIALDDDDFVWLDRRFWMSETEVTNAVMSAVLQWAYDNGRFSTTVSDHNGLDTSTAKHGGQQLLDLDDPECRVDYNGSGDFTAESGFEDNPVTNITWYGAIMFCNWLTEMRDGNISNVVYAGIDTDWIDDETTETITKNGYRLFSGDEWSDEWEYAARYRGSDTVNTVSNFPPWDPGAPYFTQGDSASGATSDYNNTTACRAVAVYSGQSPIPTDEAAVKSLGAGSANTLGLYDMSGNVWEWGFTAFDDSRVIRGGSWGMVAGTLRVGYLSDQLPSLESGSWGFRLCRTQPAD